MEPSREYLNGFNHGYFLHKYEPELLEDVLKSPQVDNQYFEGLKDGKAEFNKELSLVKDNPTFPDLTDAFEERLNQSSKNNSEKEKGTDREPEP